MPFSDVADCDILESRRGFDLDTMVPFHFFARNPFDGRVQEDHLIKILYWLLSIYVRNVKLRDRVIELVSSSICNAYINVNSLMFFGS
mgnify:CR=1 FL=1